MLDMDNLLPLLEVIVSFIDEGVVIADDQANVYYMNPSAYELLAVPANHPVRRLDDITVVALNDIYQSWHQSRSSARTTKLEHRVPLVDGGFRDLEFECCFSGEGAGRLRLLILRDVTQRRRLEAYLNRSTGDLITNDPQMLEMLQRVEQVAPKTATVLLQGESGTGKTHIARLIHRLSPRTAKTLIEVNCAAIPEMLLESELFGHIKGAFTGAIHDRKGRFQLASGSTLFLDEVGEIPLHLQPKLLRAIQDQRVEPVGSDKSMKVDVRIIAASNRNLREMVDRGEFRADLYYRLAVIPIYIPPVRERPGDIPLLLKHFCYNLNTRGYPNDIQCSNEALSLMMDYPWPGNVRELENAVEHAIICSVNKIVRPESLPMDVRSFKSARHGPAPASELDPIPLLALPCAETYGTPGPDFNQLNRAQIEEALARSKGNRNLAAKMLGVDRTTLWRRMRRLQMQMSGGT